MALIGQIRKNFWIPLLLIGLGLGGFIIMDMTSGQQSAFGGNQFTLGEIDGVEVDWNQFNRTENLLYSNSGSDIFARRNVLWNYMVEKAIITQEAEEIGLGVSRDELIDLQFGPTPSPIIQQRFRNPNTGQVDRQQLNQFRTAIETNTLTDPQMRAFWAHQETEVIKERLQSKLGALVAKGMYTPTWMAEMGHVEQSLRVDFAYVKVPFDEIPNSEVELSDSDFEAFLNENRAAYERDQPTRQVAYVQFNIEPTASDSALWREQIAELIPEFEETEDDSLFAERNYGSYDPAYVTREALSPVIADQVFDGSIGAVYGPYEENGSYKAVKVIDRKVVPDSVRARHILIPANDPATFMQAQNLLDSLMNLLETGAEPFDSLAAQYGTDATRTRGGDLGFAAPGQMVKPFNDLIFYEAEPGELNTVLTQFGLHLVEVTDRKYLNNTMGARVAYLQQSIIPSEDTQNDLYNDVLEFTGNNRSLEALEAAVAADPSLSLETSPWLQRNDYLIGNLGGGQPSRDIIRWAFQADPGEVSPSIYIYQDPVEYYNSKYVVAALEEALPAGLPPVSAIRDDIEAQVRNQKKADLLRDQMRGQNLQTVAENYDTSVDSLQNISFQQGFISGLGNEPAVIGSLFALQEGQVSEPIAGNSGVFMVHLLRKPELGAPTDIPQIRRRMSAGLPAQASNLLMQSMVENADIEDNRSRFY